MRFSDEPNAKRRIISKRLTSQISTSHDFRARSQNHQNNTELTLGLQRNTYIGSGYSIGYERLFASEFGGAFFGGDAERSSYFYSPFLFIETSPTQKLRGKLVFETTYNAYDFDFGAGQKFPRVSRAALANPNAPLDPGTGKALFIEAEVEYLPTAASSVSLDYTKSSLVRDDTDLTAFDDNIFTLRSAYQFTRFTFVRARVDYSTLNANVRGQFLLGYTPNPGTSFYVGYNDDLNRNGYSPFTRQLEPGFRRNGRTFFIKASYLIRKSFG